MRLRSGTEILNKEKEANKNVHNQEHLETSHRNVTQHEAHYRTRNGSWYDFEKYTKRNTMNLIGISLLVLLFSLAVLPVFMKTFPCLVTEVVFLQRVRWPPFINLTNPEEFRLNYTRNLRLETKDGVSLGVWHILPSSMHSEEINDFESSLHKDIAVMLYLHGNAGTRAGWHRVQLYKHLSRMNFHVFTLDYRGFADSTGYPNEEGVVRDALHVYNYIRSINKTVSIYIWGHSLGSAIATKVTKYLCQNQLEMNGLILEAPFNNIVDAAHNHPLSWILKPMPWYEWMFIDSLHHQNISFATDQSIAEVTTPTIILHAEDDCIVPFKLGKKLYKEALKKKAVGGIEFFTFDGKHGYGHKHIHKSPELPSIIKTFVKNCEENAS